MLVRLPDGAGIGGGVGHISDVYRFGVFRRCNLGDRGDDWGESLDEFFRIELGGLTGDLSCRGISELRSNLVRSKGVSRRAALSTSDFWIFAFSLRRPRTWSRPRLFLLSIATGPLPGTVLNRREL